MRGGPPVITAVGGVGRHHTESVLQAPLEGHVPLCAPFRIRAHAPDTCRSHPARRDRGARPGLRRQHARPRRGWRWRRVPGDHRGRGAYGGRPTTSGAGAPAGGTAVAIDSFAFSPATLKTRVGQKVTWTNRQGVAHTVTANGAAFNHPMPSGARFSFAFTKAGTFAYHCTIHPSMHGTIVVS